MSSQPEELTAQPSTSNWDELRSRPRYFPDPKATRVRIESDNHDPIVAVLVDESFDGIGVLCCNSTSFQVDQVVRVLYRCAQLTAIVKYHYYSDDSESQSRLGLAWQESMSYA